MSLRHLSGLAAAVAMMSGPQGAYYDPPPPPKPKAAPNPKKRAKVKAARKQRRKAR